MGRAVSRRRNTRPRAPRACDDVGGVLRRDHAEYHQRTEEKNHSHMLRRHARLGRLLVGCSPPSLDSRPPRRCARLGTAKGQRRPAVPDGRRPPRSVRSLGDIPSQTEMSFGTADTRGTYVGPQPRAGGASGRCRPGALERHRQEVSSVPSMGAGCGRDAPAIQQGDRAPVVCPVTQAAGGDARSKRACMPRYPGYRLEACCPPSTCPWS